MTFYMSVCLNSMMCKKAATIWMIFWINLILQNKHVQKNSTDLTPSNDLGQQNLPPKKNIQNYQPSGLLNLCIVI